MTNASPAPEDIERYRQEAMEYAARAIPHNNDVFLENTNETEYHTFLDEHPGRGTLKVQVSTARGNFPVDETSVVVSSIINGEKRRIYSSVTDSSGIAENMILPALPSSLSQNAETAAFSGTEYIVSIKNSGYEEKNDIPIVIFDKIQTILPVTLIPLTN